MAKSVLDRLETGWFHKEPISRPSRNFAALRRRCAHRLKEERNDESRVTSQCLEGRLLCWKARAIYRIVLQGFLVKGDDPMKLGITGLPQSGKSTIFAAISGARGEEKASRSDQRITTIKVPDERVDFLTALFRPKKSTYTHIEYVLPSQTASTDGGKAENAALTQARIWDALIHVIRNFKTAGDLEPDPEADFWQTEEEMIVSDLVVAEKRLEHMDLDAKRGKKPDEEEYSLIKSCREMLEAGEPLRVNSVLATAPALRGFTFLSSKPQLVIINNDEEDEALPEFKRNPPEVEMVVVRGRLEKDIGTMSPEEAREFLEAYHIQESVLDRVIKRSYGLLHLISFFTVINEEVRAWALREGLPALEAAGTVHSDMKKGFIRAEILSYDHLKQYGSFQQAKQKGLVHLEGKEYIVKDGDIIQFRFNV
jgi:GTP-binding protein YchF